MAKEEIDLMECSYEEFRARFKALGLENFQGDLSRRIESLEDESVKEFLKLFNELEVDPNDETKELLLPLRPLSYVLNVPHEDIDAKLAYMVRSNLLLDKMILQRDEDMFYGFLPEGHKGLTLLEHAIIKNHFKLAQEVGERVSKIDQSKLSDEEKSILATQMELYDSYQDSIMHEVKISEFEVFQRTYTYRKAIKEGSAELKEALIAAAIPLNLRTFHHYLNIKFYKYKQAVHPYDYLGEESTEELLEVFKSTGLTASDLAYITDDGGLKTVEEKSRYTKDQLEVMRIEYISRSDPQRLYKKISQIQDQNERHNFIKHVISTALLTDRLDIMDMIIYDVLKGKIKITDQSLIYSLFVLCAGWMPKSPEVLTEYTAELSGNINSIRQYDRETLELSAQKFQIQILQHLISDCGANPDIRSGLGITAFIIATERGNLEVVKFMIAREANLDMKSQLIRKVFMIAAENGHIELLKFLIASGANIDIKNEDGETALMIALERDNLEVLKFLIASGANIDIKNEDGQTALMIALGRGNLEVLKFLIASGANLDIQDQHGRTALMIGLGGGRLEMLKFLIASGANLDIQDKYGRTALMIALERGRLEMLKFLIASGANPDMQDKDTKTALTYALEQGHLDIVKALITAGADIDEEYKYFKPEIKKIADKIKQERLNPKLKELRYVKEGLADLESLTQKDMLKQKKESFENEMKGRGLTIKKLQSEFNDEELKKIVLFVASLGLNVKGFDQVQLNKLIKTATKIIDKGIKEKINPELVVNKLAEQLVIKAEMIRIREKRGFASKLFDKEIGKGRSGKPI